ncbi:hypothetical protein JR316_0001082 [Psilocybe cubensis]|uniref:Uncharacterized protein n=2 Tax=Psilocybe cubensis TaxID=181762 RepID=A0ACB8HHS0_PSICU|nr:hypothetical protein JR316_0001082 [Psilocybe cubensis]KAH9487016.1 hypothetical protein JR316_0001082 [Psilocybe cubensis]
MPLRALRLLPFPTTSEPSLATSLSFATTLQLAAARAWSRRVQANASTTATQRRRVNTPSSPTISSNESNKSLQPSPSDSKRRQYGAISSTPITRAGSDNNRVKCSESKAPHPSSSRSHTKPKPLWGDPVSNNLLYNPQLQLDPVLPKLEQNNLSPQFSSKPPLQPTHTAFADSPHFASSATPPTPESTGSLHQNLLYLLHVRRPLLSLPALLDYHAQFPNLHSTSSYNLLISLSLRHGSYGMTQQLLRRLEDANIPKNVETYKLEVRWYIGKGLWNNAWNYVQELMAEKRLPSDEIPYQIWLEFCRTPRARRVRRNLYDEDGQFLRTYFERLDEAPADLRKRQKLISDNRPSNVPTLPNTKPFAVYCLTQLLIRTGNRHRALDLAKAYFQSLPRSMDTKSALRCLDTIHALMVSCPAKNGLPRFYEARRMLVSLLKLHPSLRPNSRTIYLLLGPLQRAKKCGTIAWKTLSFYRRVWGEQVEDKRVRRRVSHLALKEGRMDVVNQMMQSEASDRYRQRRLHEEVMANGVDRGRPGWHIHFPPRELYPKYGRETRLWTRLRGKLRNFLKKRKGAGRNI